MNHSRPSLLLTSLLGAATGVGISCGLWIIQEHKLMNTLFAFMAGGAGIGAVTASSGYKMSELQILRSKAQEFLGVEEGDSLMYYEEFPEPKEAPLEPLFGDCRTQPTQPPTLTIPITSPEAPPASQTSETEDPDPWAPPPLSRTQTIKQTLSSPGPYTLFD